MKSLFCAALLICLISSPGAKAQWCPKYRVKVFHATAAYPYGLNRIVAKIRTALGGIDNGSEEGPLKNGHRSINWDADAVPFNMPGDFFKNTVTRGAEFKTPKQKFAVSNPPKDDPSGIIDNEFSSFNRNFPRLFRTFSPKRLFTPVFNNKVQAIFSVPAKGNKAIVSGFGAVFTNVVLKGKTVIKFFDSKNCLIYKQVVRPKPNGLSFAGIVVVNKWNRAIPKIAKVEIVLGNAAIASNYYNWKNVVVLDDLIYGEPQGIVKKGGKPYVPS